MLWFSSPNVLSTQTRLDFDETKLEDVLSSAEQSSLDTYCWDVTPRGQDQWVLTTRSCPTSPSQGAVQAFTEYGGGGGGNGTGTDLVQNPQNSYCYNGFMLQIFTICTTLLPCEWLHHTTCVRAYCDLAKQRQIDSSDQMETPIRTTSHCASTVGNEEEQVIPGIF